MPTIEITSTCLHIALTTTTRVGGVAQWLGRRSLAGRLSLIYAWPMVDIWPHCGQDVRSGQPTRPTQPSIPPGSV